MEEIWELQKKLAAVQMVSTSYKLSERNCIEIVSKLISQGLLEVFYTVNGREYVTPKQLKYDIKDEVISSGGRVSLMEIQSVLNVDINHVENMVKSICLEDPEFLLVNGEILTSWYLEGLSDIVEEIIHEKGFVSLGNLAVRLNLPTEMTADMVKQRLMKKISAVLKRGILFSLSHEKKLYAKVRGYCLGATKPLPVSSLASSLNMEDEEVFDIISHLCNDGALPGSTRGRDYIPLLYSQLQRSSCDQFFRTNGYMEYSRIKKLQVSKPLDFLQQSFPEAIGLKSCAVSPEIVQTVSSELEDLNNRLVTSWQSHPWLHVPSHVPSGIDHEDCEGLLKMCLTSTSSSTSSGSSKKSSREIDQQKFPNLINLGNLCLIHKAYFNLLREVFQDDALKVAKDICTKHKHVLAPGLKAAAGVTMSDVGSRRADEENDGDDDVGKKKKKKGKGSDTATVAEDDDDDEDNERGKGKGGSKRKDGKKEDKKSSKKSGSGAGSSQGPSLATSTSAADPKMLLAPYLKRVRVVALIRANTRSLKQPTKEGGEGDADGYEDDDEDSDSTGTVLRGVAELLEDEIKDVYGRSLAAAIETLQQGDLAERRKRETARDTFFENEWSELLVISKGLSSLTVENQGKGSSTDDGNGKRSVRILWAITAFYVWENSVDLECPVLTPSSRQSSTSDIPLLSTESKQLLLKQLPKEVGQLLNKLWNLITSALSTAIETKKPTTPSTATTTTTPTMNTLQDFMELLDTQGQKTFQLIVRKVDKKRDKQTAFTIRQNVMEFLRGEDSDEVRILQLSLNLIFHYHDGNFIDIPPSVSGMRACLRWLKGVQGISETTANLIENILDSNILNSDISVEAAQNGEGGKTLGDDDAVVAELISTLKDSVLNKKH